ncbi:MAG TPA: hypothetical protein VG389_10440 [Myxococcota bacterium]|nr:hypothetical protein [Myxococcota bacterium]
MRAWTFGVVGLSIAAATMIGGCRGCTCGSKMNDSDGAADATADAATDAATDAMSPDSGSPPCLTGTVPTLGLDDTVDFSFCPPDPQIADLMGLYALSEATVVGAFESDPASAPRAPYDFAGFGSRWVAAQIDNPTGVITVRVRSSALDVALLCIQPDGAMFFVHDDFVGTSTDAGLNLLIAGTWTCLATTSPHTDLVPANMPLGPARFEITAN